ncbi:hypothetical protein H7J93_12995 [Mycobacterium barrassiae]|uniref:RyR domain-containing protein n=1 Tax=Mycobacterium barrassiae TaxID=319709 RepID=UPI002265ED9E|nr:RyR domain-containing protein [Mycobacterium barrassiae]MCV7300546.1 hypothetical protein [Mycobacterium barrassiae]
MRGAVARVSLTAIVLLLLGYLAVIAAVPQLREGLSPAWQWFGSPGSWQTLAIVTVLLLMLGAVVFNSRSVGRTSSPVTAVVGLVLITITLGLASYWRCFDEDNPKIFTPVIWTANLVKGGTGDHELEDGEVCPLPIPVALDIARLTAIAAIFLSVIGVAMALFQSHLDRLRISLAPSVTAVVDIDDDAASMVGAIAATLGRRSALVVIAASPDRQCVRDARSVGARVVAADFAKPAWTALPLWRKLDRLYLLSPDAAANLQRLALITERLPKDAGRQRLPLIVRIDDPWQAAAWRAQHFGGAETRWAADTVGKYEVTARRLLDDILDSDTAVERILVCGASELTLALCAEIAQRQLEWDYYAAPDRQPLPCLTLVAENAEEYKQDHQFARQRMGQPPDRPQVTAQAERPSVPLLISLVEAAPAETAVILVDDARVDANTGTRLAARYPTTPIYAWNPAAQETDDRTPVVGQLFSYRLSMHMPAGKAHDAWERAARLIHDRYVAEIDSHSAATLPWDQLSEFYRGSNRRQVRNALWMVEKIGGHTWNTFGHEPISVSTATLHDLAPLERLRVMGFDEDTALAMARCEHEEWCRYYRAAGWKYGPVRDDTHKVHDKLVGWEAIAADNHLLSTALASLADTLSKLRELGYISRPAGDPSTV